MTDQLLLTPLEDALNTLLEAINEYERDTSKTIIRDGLVQRFEYCYDATTKMLKRHLSNISENPSEINEMDFQTIVRDAYTKGLLKNSWDQWGNYRHARNITSHSYDEEKAIEVVDLIPVFYNEAIYFLIKLQEYYKAV